MGGRNQNTKHVNELKISKQIAIKTWTIILSHEVLSVLFSDVQREKLSIVLKSTCNSIHVCRA